MADKDKVVGKALYMEFRSSNQTYQMIITPDGLTLEGRNIPATVYRRQISSSRPRRAWKTLAFPKLPQDPSGVFNMLNVDAAKEQATSRAGYLESNIQRLHANGFTLFMKPIIVEVSQADLDDIRYAKTPYKILGRITRARKVLGFGERLFA